MDIKDPHARLHSAFGIAPSGALMVRPDGFVGWRAESAIDATDHAAVLEAALATILGRLLAKTERFGEDGALRRCVPSPGQAGREPAHP